MNIQPLTRALALALLSCAAPAIAGPVGYGAATTGGGNAVPVNVATLEAMQAAIDGYAGSGGLVLHYTGQFDFASIGNVCAQWQLPAKTVQIKNKSDITIKGASGSSANFGLRVVGNAHNVVIRNMTIGLLPAARTPIRSRWKAIPAARRPTSGSTTTRSSRR
jgi:pectate lyase